VPTAVRHRSLRLPGWHVIPRWFHTLGTIFLGLKVTVMGKPSHGRPTLIVSNHISWTDIVAIGSVADVTFVAKQEVKKWFFVGFMASLQRSVFVDRNRRTDAKRTTTEMANIMAEGEAVLLFAEGQSDVGTHVLPFRSALVGAAQQAMVEAGAKDVMIQPLTIAYTRLQGLPVGRTDRNLIAWIKGKSVKEEHPRNPDRRHEGSDHRLRRAEAAAAGADRKKVTKEAENEVRAMLVALNRGEQVPRPKAMPVPARSRVAHSPDSPPTGVSESRPVRNRFTH
jgi:1-acyl-sn-glycerol-3-phosphate acyltransferase